MSHVWKGLDLSTNKTVAIKIFKTAHFGKDVLTKSIAKEGFILSLMNHETIMKAVDVIINDTYQALVLEYLDGTSLKKYQSTSIFQFSDKEQRLWIALKIIEAIDYISRFQYQDSQGKSYKGIFHRDLKPDNFVITKSGQLKLIDFGLSTITTSSKIIPRLIDGYSKHYADPDLVDFEKYEIKNEFYSLGVILNEVLELNNQNLEYEDDELQKLKVYVMKLLKKQEIEILPEFVSILNNRYTFDNLRFEFSEIPSDDLNNSENEYTVVETEFVIDFEKYFYSIINERNKHLLLFVKGLICIPNRCSDIMKSLVMFRDMRTKITVNLESVFLSDDYDYIHLLYTNPQRINQETRSFLFGNDFEVAAFIVYAIYVKSLEGNDLKITHQQVKELLKALNLKVSEVIVLKLLGSWQVRYIAMVDGMGIYKKLRPFEVTKKLQLIDAFTDQSKDDLFMKASRLGIVLPVDVVTFEIAKILADLRADTFTMTIPYSNENFFKLTSGRILKGRDVDFEKIMVHPLFNRIVDHCKIRSIISYFKSQDDMFLSSELQNSFDAFREQLYRNATFMFEHDAYHEKEGRFFLTFEQVFNSLVFVNAFLDCFDITKDPEVFNNLRAQYNKVYDLNNWFVISFDTLQEFVEEVKNNDLEKFQMLDIINSECFRRELQKTRLINSYRKRNDQINDIVKKRKHG